MRLHTGLYGHRKRACTESCLREKNPLPHGEIEPVSAACRSDALPTERHPQFIPRKIKKTKQTKQNKTTTTTKKNINKKQNRNSKEEEEETSKISTDPSFKFCRRPEYGFYELRVSPFATISAFLISTFPDSFNFI